jgi:YegS/Rv2252/BmrU family lipid kinase
MTQAVDNIEVTEPTPTLATPVKMRVAVIANPASGVNRSALEIIEQFLVENAKVIEATLHLTKASGDAMRFAQDAVRQEVDLVAAYGGDGTLMEVASGLRGSAVPLLMLPGGTANVMAIDLQVPLTLENALELMLDPTHQIADVDMGRADDELFLLRLGIGYEAEMSANAERSEKSKAGRWAYVRNAWQKMRNLRPTRYVLTIDGETHVRYGVTCMICNSSSIGIPNLRFVYNGDVSDGFLDVIVIRNMQMITVLRTLWHILRSRDRREEHGGVHIDHWQAKEVTVQMKDRQFVARDGEPMKRSKRVSVHIVPKAIKVIVPASKQPALENNDALLDRD